LPFAALTHSAIRAQKTRLRSTGPPLLPPKSAEEQVGTDGRPIAWSRPAATPRRRDRGRLIHRYLLTADVCALVIGFLATQLVVTSVSGLPGRSSPGWAGLVFVLTVPVWVVAAHLGGLYGRDGRHPDHSTADEVVGIVAVVTFGTWVFWAAAALTGTLTWQASEMVAFWAIAIALVILGRTAGRTLARRRRSQFVQNAIVVGTNDVGQAVARKLRRHPEYGIEVVGFVDGRPRQRGSTGGRYVVLGRTERLPDLVEVFGIDRVIIAGSNDPDGVLLGIIHRLRATSIQVDLVPNLFQAVDAGADVHTIETLPLVGLRPVHRSAAGRITKRTIDVVLAGVTLIATAPLFAYLAWRIKRDSPGPVFFRQTRLGLHMRPFTALKFRTMRTDVDDSCHRDYIRSTMDPRALTEQNGLYKLERTEHVTSVGRFLRRTSLDELPQLINVLRGDMAIVGPRPCIPYETENFAPHHFDRFLVPAGVTGLWQVSARARATFGEALEMDVAYARGWSLGLDLRLICRTPAVMLRQAATA
jgi:exopolysaccharide biosynthesis polyprenyl glycosylphosphotransferase